MGGGPRDGAQPVHGVSQLPHLSSGAADLLRDRYLFWDLYAKVAAVRGRWKLVGEVGNHHGKCAADQPAVYRDLKGRYLRWFERATR